MRIFNLLCLSIFVFSFGYSQNKAPTTSQDSLMMLQICNFAQGSQKIIYKDSTASIEARVQDLLSRMTVNKKVGQLSTLLGWKMYTKTETGVKASDELKKAVQEQHIGALWGTLRADPWTQKTLKTGLDPELAAQATNAIQKTAVEDSRLGIPLFLAEEAMHGHMAIGTTVFPTAIGQAATFNPSLIEEMGKAIAHELRTQGAHIGYGPILDLSREPRWSRVEETFGEDPELVAQMGQALVKGFQGAGIEHKNTVISTLKHFAAYGVSEGGHNGGAVHLGKRDLYQEYLYPFKKAIDAGALSIMTAYSSVDGIPSTANRELLTNVLKGQWNFPGFVVSDLGSIEGLQFSHHIASAKETAAQFAINAGVDADLGGGGFGESLFKAIQAGEVSERRLDEAVSRILRLKFAMGLFENPYVDASKVSQVIRSKQHEELALKIAEQSIVLLKNENGLLPLSKKLKRIAAIGPNADAQYNQLGDYTAPQKPGAIFTVLEGVKELLPGAQVDYVKGTAIRDTTQTAIEAAVRAAKNAEVAIVVLGGSSARDFKTEYQETGAAHVSRDETILPDMESGEGFDRSTLGLMGKQLKLLQAVQATGTPTVLVLIKGRPLLLNWPAAHTPAILDAWYPGAQGGRAIANVIFGKVNPAGRLPVSVPKSVGQLPIYYNALKPARRDYVEEDGKPLFAFGFGLSYTTFEYGNLQISVDEKGAETEISVSCTVINTGKKDGEEVIQLYVRDEVSSVVTAIRQLRGFERVFLPSGESQKIKFTLTPKDLSLYTADFKKVAEAGKFTLQIGPSSDAIKLETSFELASDIEVD